MGAGYAGDGGEAAWLSPLKRLPQKILARLPQKNLMQLSHVARLPRLLDMDERKDPFDVVWPGLLASLDQLPTDARVAFLLSQVFDMRVDDVAALLRSDARHCRELVEQARAHIQSVCHEKRKERGDKL